MGFFEDDPFDEILKEFFGQNSRPRTSSQNRNIVRSEREERLIDYIEEDDSIYFVFEIPGYSSSDIDVSLKGRNLEISAIKNNYEDVQAYLQSKLQKGVYFKKIVPDNANIKKMNYHFKNGILEVVFLKK